MLDSTAPVSASPEAIQKVRQLVAYLRDFVSLRSKATKKIESYESQGAVIWFHQMPQERDCQSLIWGAPDDTDEDVWLRVRQQQIPRRPLLPGILAPWIDERDLQRTDDDYTPELEHVALVRQRLESGKWGESVEQRLENQPEVSTAWQTYLPSWTTWSREYRRTKNVQRVYRELYAIHQQLEQNGELVELAIGVGLLQWKRKSGEIKRHVLTYRAELKFDVDLGELRVFYPQSGSRPILEDEMLEPDDRPLPSRYQEINRYPQALSEDPWNEDKLAAFFGAWAKSLHEGGQYSMELAPAGGFSEEPVIDFAPAILLRPRSSSAILQVYKTLHEMLSKESPIIPFGLLRLIEDLNDEQPRLGGSGNERDDSPGESEEIIYFPKPANPEQRQIVQKLRSRHGVLVQGPPGTGKSYTIGNLICHLLAEGKRILVTSEGPRALKVLSEHIPSELRSLCVRNLGGDADSFKELEQCVSGIEQRHNNFVAAVYTKHISELKGALDRLNRKLATLDSELRSLRESETQEVSVADGVYRGKPSAIAQRLTEESEACSWCALDRSTSSTPPLDDREFDHLVELGRFFTPDRLSESTLYLPFSHSILAAADFERIIRELTTHEVEAAAVSDWITSDFWKPFLDLSPQAQKEVSLASEKWIGEWELWNSKSSPWGESVLQDLGDGKEEYWATLRNNSQSLLRELEPVFGIAEITHIETPPDCSAQKLEHDALQMVEHLRSGKGWGLLGIPVGKTSEFFYLKKDCRVDGAPCRTEESLVKLAKISGARWRMDKLEALWGAVTTLQGTGISQRYSQISHLQTLLEEAFDLAANLQQLNSLLEVSRLPKLGIQITEITNLRYAFHVCSISRSLEAARSAYEQTLDPVTMVGDLKAHPIVSKLATAGRNRDVDAWKALQQKIAPLEDQQSARRRFDYLFDKLKSSDPKLSSTVRSKWNDEAWATSRPNFTRAWNWGVGMTWLTGFADGLELQQLSSERKETGAQIESATASLAAEKAWLHFLTRIHLQPQQNNALRAWREAVKALGKGTGKSRRSEDLRRSARENATKASESIPAWIMPRYKVAEMMSIKPESFDVIIVDEASQSGIDSLFLFYLAKKIIIVGDDQQISPSLGFVDADQISALQRHHLQGLPHEIALRPESSLYANAKIRFDGITVLREHFRCATEIIQFSNGLCYEPNGTPLDPLRLVQHPRLIPLQSTFVAEGYREGGSSNAVNVPEAEALVAQIVKCHEDSAYRDKTFGVVSLQGIKQAKTIEKLLMEHPKLGTKIMSSRKIACGDAYDFQGDERNVMFLSMVVAPNQETIGVLSKSSDYQRFNVAASRARDQMWIFHSVQLADLSQQCVRYKLLDYMLHPQVPQRAENEHRFDSEFERDVYREIINRGYTVRTQVGVGDTRSYRYRIDLVVEGLRNRLAVECDGDEWHGPDRYEEDAARQRNLERAGWNFWRVRGSAYYSNRQKALENLWTTLLAMGIRTNAEEDREAGLKEELAKANDIKAQADQPAVLILPAEDQDDDSSLSAGAEKENLASSQNESIGTPADPRVASQGQILEGFTRIIAAEGPVVCSRVYALYVKQCGIGRLTKPMQSIFNRAMAKAVRSKSILQLEDNRKGQIDKTVRLPDQPEVLVRQKTDRRWDEIPPTELKSVAAAFLQKDPSMIRQQLARSVYEFFGGVRLRRDTEAEILQIIDS